MASTTDTLGNVVSTIVLAGMTLEMIKRVYPKQYAKEKLRRTKAKKTPKRAKSRTKRR